MNQTHPKLLLLSVMHCLLKSPLLFLHRRKHEDLNLLGIIVNQETRRLSRQVIRVKWSLHAREEIVYEHLRGNAARSLLEGIRKSTREMIEEQEAEKKMQIMFLSTDEWKSSYSNSRLLIPPRKGANPRERSWYNCFFLPHHLPIWKPFCQ